MGQCQYILKKSNWYFSPVLQCLITSSSGTWVLGFFLIVFFLVRAPWRSPDRQAICALTALLVVCPLPRHDKACIYKLLLMDTTFLPAFTFCYTISSFSQEQTWFPPEALILSSCIAFTADDALELVRSPPKAKYSEQPASQGNFIAKIYLK